jgi:hypothetical protein
MIMMRRMKMKTEKVGKKRTLIDITEDYRQLLLSISDDAGEVANELMLELDECDAEFTVKVDSALFVAEEFFAAAEGYKKRAKALSEHSKAMENRGKQLRFYVLAAMKQLNIQQLSTPTFPTIYRRKNIGTTVTDEVGFLEAFGEDTTFVEWLPKVYLEPIKKILKGLGEKEEHPIKKFATLTESESLVVK